MSIDAVFAQFFYNIPDPRQHAKIYYPFYDVLFLTVCAVIGGADGWEDIEDFGEVHLPWFQSKGLFKNGIPVHDTIARIISGIKPEPFQAAFVRWTQAINSTPMAPWLLSMAKPCAVPITVKIERRPFTW
jgi:predicted transposase YbfD/YdcC